MTSYRYICGSVGQSHVQLSDKITGPCDFDCDCDSPRSGSGGRPPDNLKTDTARPDPLEHRDGLVVAQTVQSLAVH